MKNERNEAEDGRNGEQRREMGSSIVRKGKCSNKNLVSITIQHLHIVQRISGLHYNGA